MLVSYPSWYKCTDSLDYETRFNIQYSIDTAHDFPMLVVDSQVLVIDKRRVASPQIRACQSVTPRSAPPPFSTSITFTKWEESTIIGILEERQELFFMLLSLSIFMGSCITDCLAQFYHHKHEMNLYYMSMLYTTAGS